MYPKFYDRNSVSNLYLPRYQEVAKESQLNNIGYSIERNALFVIDGQIGFCMPGASLYVKGAENDVANICEFAYRNMDNISTMIFSLDTHYTYQIFYPSFWVDENGNNPEPYTIITYQDILDEKWTPVIQQDFAVNYVKQLEATGKYNLCIWDYHTMMGSIDHALHPMLSECAFYHSLKKNKPTEFILKGENQLTENYSVFAPEVKALRAYNEEMTVGCFDSTLFLNLMGYDKIFIAGEASSHCVKATIEDLLAKIMEFDPKLANKIYILEDCMSPVPAIPGVDFPAIAQQALNRFREAGMNIVKSTDF